jgi:hypothetical protein
VRQANREELKYCRYEHDNCPMAPRRYVGAPFLAIGIAFLVIGITGNRAFIGIGVAFIVIALTRMRRP